MPGMNGVQLASRIKGQSSETPVILLTGFGDEMQALSELPSGVDLVLGKPVTHADLRHAIFQALNRRESLVGVA
jgi:FixJ family two-component response regulator